MTQRKFNSIDDFEPITKQSKLGKGSFATKFVKKMELDQGRNLKQQIESIKTEIEIHKNLNHKNIITLYDYFLENGNIYLIMEYASNGNLFMHIRKKRIQTLRNYKKIFKQTCQALQYIHSKGIVHRDLKPENILLDKNFNIKICDFGWSALTEYKRTTFCGTYEYMAPEIFEGQRYNQKVDSWSLGILLYELLHQQSPFRADSFNMVYKNIRRQVINFSSSISLDAKNLIRQILQINPQQRPTVDQILMSNFFNDFEKENQNNNIIKSKSFVKKVNMKKKKQPQIQYGRNIKNLSILTKHSNNSQNKKKTNWSFLRKPQTQKKCSLQERIQNSQQKQYYKKSFLQQTKQVNKKFQFSMNSFNSIKQKENSLKKLKKTHSLNQICQALKKSYSQRILKTQKSGIKQKGINLDFLKSRQNSLQAKSPFRKYILKAKLQNKFMTLQKQQTMNSPYYVF